MFERLIEKSMYSARWLLAPIYLGLSLVILALGLKFFQEIFHILPAVFATPETSLILKVLSLVDITLVCGLLVMVMFSGYENFVSRIDMDDESEKLSWLGTMDANSLKSKVAASIVAISSIHLLRLFMSEDSAMTNERLLTYVIMHLTFVLSAFAMGYLDHVTKKKSI